MTPSASAWRASDLETFGTRGGNELAAARKRVEILEDHAAVEEGLAALQHQRRDLAERVLAAQRIGGVGRCRPSTISMRSESPSTAAAILTFRAKGEEGEERKIIMAVFPVRDETGPNGACCRNRRGDHIKRAFHNRPGASAGFARFPLPSTAQASERVVIIGSGPAGYTAAIYAARAMLQPAAALRLRAGRPVDDHDRRRELSRLRRARSRGRG